MPSGPVGSESTAIPTSSSRQWGPKNGSLHHGAPRALDPRPPTGAIEPELLEPIQKARLRLFELFRCEESAVPQGSQLSNLIN